MTRPADLTSWRHDDDFRDDPVPQIVIDRDFVIRAVNPADERATGFSLEEIEGRELFEVFPANPHEADGGDGVASMAASFERVLREEKSHDLVVQRYDVPDPRDPGRFVTRTWLPVNAPARVGADGTVAGIVVRAEMIELPEEADRVLRRFRDALRDRQGSDDGTTVQVIDAVLWGLRSLSQSHREAVQLREALSSRATIDQAKGILMAQRRIDAEAAFQVLIRLSNESNVRLADVARALVYQVQSGGDLG